MVQDVIAQIARCADELIRAGEELEKQMKAAKAAAAELDKAVFTVKELDKQISQKSSEVGDLSAKHDEIKSQLAALRAKF